MKSNITIKQLANKLYFDGYGLTDVIFNSDLSDEDFIALSELPEKVLREHLKNAFSLALINNGLKQAIDNIRGAAEDAIENRRWEQDRQERLKRDQFAMELKKAQQAQAMKDIQSKKKKLLASMTKEQKQLYKELHK